jgi:hypothetical protein
VSLCHHEQHEDENEFHDFLSLNVKGPAHRDDELALVVGV